MPVQRSCIAVAFVSILACCPHLQVAVLDHALSWFRAEDDPVSPPPASPVCLVHGVFGSGKSHLLVACVTLLSELLAEGPPCSPARKPQILIASATNVAVDGILLGLLASGFTDFCRVGSVKKIAKPVSGVACFGCAGACKSRVMGKNRLKGPTFHSVSPRLQLLSLVAHSQGTERARAVSGAYFLPAA